MPDQIMPRRGEIWMANLDPTLGREQAGTRPVLVLSVDNFNLGPAELVIVLPITSKNKNIPLHACITPPEGGLSVTSYVKCEDIRSISTARLSHKRGTLSSPIMEAIEEKVRLLLGL
jgi:mRNA interferase MazF